MPAVLYCFTSMTELFNYGLLMFYLAFMLRHHNTGGKVALALAWVTVVFACLYRISYVVLFLPLIWLGGGGRLSKRMGAHALVALVLAVGLYALSAALTAPYPSGFLYNWLRAKDPATFLRMFFSHAKSNLYDYFIRPTDSPMEDAFRWLYTAAMVFSGGGVFAPGERKGAGAGPWPGQAAPELLFDAVHPLRLGGDDLRNQRLERFPHLVPLPVGRR